MTDRRSTTDHPLTRLDPEDLALITQFVLASGSLKDLAKAYGVSYPTIRNRLDGVIERLREAVRNEPVDPVARTVADLVERGELSISGARSVMAVVREARANGAAPKQQTTEG